MKPCFLPVKLTAKVKVKLNLKLTWGILLLTLTLTQFCFAAPVLDPSWIKQQQSRNQTLLNSTVLQKNSAGNNLAQINLATQPTLKNASKLQAKTPDTIVPTAPLVEQNNLIQSQARAEFLATVQQIIQPQPSQDIQKIKPPTSSVLIFVSLAMPEQSLRAWLNQANQINAPLILRGLVNNSFTETAAKINSVLGKNNLGGFQIDPLWFKQFTIRAVPAVVVQEETGFDVVYGDVGLESALNAISLHGVNAKTTAQQLLKQLQGREHA